MLCVALERADAGVRVRMLVDGVDGWLKLSAAPVFRAMEAHPNVEIRFYNPPTLLTPWKVMGRMHDKYVIVDDVAYILGGRNMLDNFLGDYPVEVPKDDREALIYNAACGTPEGEASSLYQLKDYFEAIWSSDAVAGFLGEDLVEPHREDVYADLRQRLEALKAQRPKLFADTLDYGQRTVPTKGIWLISNPTNVSAKQPVAFAQLCALMDRAEQSVVIHSPYAVLNGYMRDRLAAVAERVPMTLMVNAPENSANIAGTGDYVYHRDDVLSTGAALLEYAGGNYHHGKALAIDKRGHVRGPRGSGDPAYVHGQEGRAARGRGADAAVQEHRVTQKRESICSPVFAPEYRMIIHTAGSACTARPRARRSPPSSRRSPSRPGPAARRPRSPRPP